MPLARPLLHGETHLKKPEDFDRLYRQGRRLGNQMLALRALPNGLAYSRWGIVTSKKVGKAVVRNLIRRRLREILRRCELAPGNDIVVIARAGVALHPFHELKTAALELFDRGGLLAVDEVNSPDND